MSSLYGRGRNKSSAQPTSQRDKSNAANLLIDSENNRPNINQVAISLPPSTQESSTTSSRPTDNSNVNNNNSNTPQSQQRSKPQHSLANPRYTEHLPFFEAPPPQDPLFLFQLNDISSLVQCLDMLHEPMAAIIRADKRRTPGGRGRSLVDAIEQFVPVVLRVSENQLCFSYHPTKLFGSRSAIETTMFSEYQINRKVLSEQFGDDDDQQYGGLQDDSKSFDIILSLPHLFRALTMFNRSRQYRPDLIHHNTGHQYHEIAAETNAPTQLKFEYKSRGSDVELILQSGQFTIHSRLRTYDSAFLGVDAEIPPSDDTEPGKTGIANHLLFTHDSEDDGENDTRAKGITAINGPQADTKFRPLSKLQDIKLARKLNANVMNEESQVLRHAENLLPQHLLHGQQIGPLSQQLRKQLAAQSNASAFVLSCKISTNVLSTLFQDLLVSTSRDKAPRHVTMHFSKFDTAEYLNELKNRQNQNHPAHLQKGSTSIGLNKINHLPSGQQRSFVPIGSPFDFNNLDSIMWLTTSFHGLHNDSHVRSATLPSISTLFSEHGSHAGQDPMFASYFCPEAFSVHYLYSDIQNVAKGLKKIAGHGLLTGRHSTIFNISSNYTLSIIIRVPYIVQGTLETKHHRVEYNLTAHTDVDGSEFDELLLQNFDQNDLKGSYDEDIFDSSMLQRSQDDEVPAVNFKQQQQVLATFAQLNNIARIRKALDKKIQRNDSSMRDLQMADGLRNDSLVAAFKHARVDKPAPAEPKKRKSLRKKANLREGSDSDETTTNFSSKIIRSSQLKQEMTDDAPPPRRQMKNIAIQKKGGESFAQPTIFHAKKSTRVIPSGESSYFHHRESCEELPDVQLKRKARKAVPNDDGDDSSRDTIPISTTVTPSLGKQSKSTKEITKSKESKSSKSKNTFLRAVESDDDDLFNQTRTSTSHKKQSLPTATPVSTSSIFALQPKSKGSVASTTTTSTTTTQNKGKIGLVNRFDVSNTDDTD